MALKIETPTNMETGLLPSAAATSEKNVIEASMTKSYRSIVMEHFFTLFNIINFVLAGMVIFTGSYRNMLFMGVVLFNMVIGLVQEIRSKQILDRLALLHQDKATILRAGRMYDVDVDQVVKNDIVILRAGNQVCCDCVVVEGSVEVNESMLTGESDPISKHVHDSVLSGTFVISGQAKVQVVAVGENTYAYSILKEAKRNKRYPSQLRDALQTILRFSTVILVPAGILLFARTWYATNDLNQTILSTVAALVGMIPEGLVFLTSIALAAGSIRLARQKVLVQELYCIETLARVDVLCLDKTGTITEGEMKVCHVETFQGYTDTQIKKILGNVYHALPDTNATAQAIRTYAPFYNLDTASEIYPFSSARKYAGVLFGTTLYTCGAYSFLTSQPDPAIEHAIAQYAQKGMRVIALMKTDRLQPQPKPVLLALVCLADSLRPDAKEILDYFYKQDVEIKIISGDDPRTVAAIARNAGVIGEWIDMKGIQPGAEMEKALASHSIFGRVSPEQKKEMVLALQHMGHTVAMSGDGVNDVMALKAADCSIAMGSGSQAARGVASLVLLEDQFSALPDILKQGRCIINNIQRTASLFLVKTLFSFGLAILTLLWLGQYPFQPIQLTLISSLCTGIPSFILTLEPDARRISGSFLLNVFSKALPGALNVILIVAAVKICSYITGMNEEQMASMCTILAGLNALLVLHSVCVPMTLLRAGLVTCMAVLFANAILFLPQFFLLERLPWQLNLLTLALAGGTLFSLRWLSGRSWKTLLARMKILGS